MFEYLFSSVDQRGTPQDARQTHWYGNSSLQPFGPDELKMKQGPKNLIVCFLISDRLNYCFLKLIVINESFY